MEEGEAAEGSPPPAEEAGASGEGGEGGSPPPAEEGGAGGLDGEAGEGGEEGSPPPDADQPGADGGDPDSPTAGGAGDGVMISGFVSVDFVILPEGYGQTKKLDVQMSLAQVRQELENELSIPERSLFLMNMTGAAEVTGMLDMDKRLFEYGLNANDKVAIELRINYYQEQAAEEYVMPDVLELKIPDDQTGGVKVVAVYVERPTMEKP